MDIALRVPLFYLADRMFNEYTSARGQSLFLMTTEDSTLLTTENSTLVNDQYSSSVDKLNYTFSTTGTENIKFSTSENTTFSTIKNASLPTTALPISVNSNSTFALETSFFDFEYISNLTFLHFLIIITCLMFMLIFATPTKKLFRFLWLIVPGTVLFALSFIPQVFDFSIPVDTPYIFLLRFIFFSTISCIVYLHMTSERRTASAKLTLASYLILSTLNIQDVQFHLAKYSLSAVLIFLSSHEKSFKKFQSKRESFFIKLAIIFLAFCFIHTTSLLQSKDPEEGPITQDRWRELFTQLLSTEGGVVLKVFVLISVLCCVNALLYVALNAILKVSSRCTSPAQFLRRCGISPVIFFAFFIDREFWNLERERRWAFVQIYVLMHFASVLMNFCDTIKRAIASQFDDNTVFNFRYRHYALSAITLISPICLLLVLFRLPSKLLTAAWMLATASAGFSLCFAFALFSTVLMVHHPSPAGGNRKRAIFIYDRCDFLNKCEKNVYLCCCMLLGVAIESFDLFVFVGALYFAYCLCEEYRVNWPSVRNKCLMNHCLPGSCLLNSYLQGDYTCSCCHEKIVVSVFATPCCNHHYHSGCIEVLLIDSYRCPHCQFDFTKYSRFGAKPLATLPENAA